MVSYKKNVEIANEIMIEINKVFKSKLSPNELERTIKFEVFDCGHGLHPFGSHPGPNDYIDYSIEVNGKSWSVRSKRDVENVFNNIRANYGNGFHVELIINTESSGYYWQEYKFIKSISMFAKPCKEYNSLIKWLNKYGVKTTNDYEFFMVNVCGKRGTGYTESGKRHYLCHNADRCKSILDELRKLKSTNDRLKSIKVDEIYDPDKDYGIRYETETYGEKYVGLKVQISTPKGKDKGVVEVF